MLEKYVYHGDKRLRCGFTTGSCAAAAAGAAADMLISGVEVKEFSILTPKGIPLELEILEPEIGEKYARCSVRKDSGDDPDITDRILVTAKVSLTADNVDIQGGKGVGVVTKPGLDQPVGAAAINSVPRKMITEVLESIAEKYDYHGGFSVEVSVPNGEEIARKTYNPRIGIEGGISIIGTSGIVEPMSTKALIDTIRVEENIRKAEGIKNLLMTLGNYSENFIQREMPFALEKSVQCSNYIGDAIDIALELGFDSITIVGHIGKLVKLGAGIMNTHSKCADGRMDILVTCGVLAGVNVELLKKIPDCVTVDAALDILETSGCLGDVLDILAQRADFYLNSKVNVKVRIAAVMFSDKKQLVVKTKDADELLNLIAEEYNG